MRVLTGLLCALVLWLVTTSCRPAEAEPSDVDLSLAFVHQDTAGVTVSWRNPADDGNGPLDSALIRSGRVMGGAFQPQSTTAIAAFGFGANQSTLVLVELGALDNTVRACVALKRRELIGAERCGDLNVVGPDVPPPPPDTVGLSVSALDVWPDSIIIIASGQRQFCVYYLLSAMYWAIDPSSVGKPDCEEEFGRRWAMGRVGFGQQGFAGIDVWYSPPRPAYEVHRDVLALRSGWGASSL